MVLYPLFLKVLFFRITFLEFNVGNILYFAKALISKDIFDNQERYEKIRNFAKKNIIASHLIPSIHIDLGSIIDFCKNKNEIENEQSDEINNTMQ